MNIIRIFEILDWRYPQVFSSWFSGISFIFLNLFSFMETTMALDMVAFAKGIAFLAIIGPGIAVGLIGKGAMESIGRNPASTKSVRENMILALAFAEVLGLLPFLALFLL